jgi:hypothetical protein
MNYEEKKGGKELLIEESIYDKLVDLGIIDINSSDEE